MSRCDFWVPFSGSGRLENDIRKGRLKSRVSYFAVFFTMDGTKPNRNPNPNPNPYETPVGMPPNDVTGVKWLKKHNNVCPWGVRF